MNQKFIISWIGALALGLGLGYLFFYEKEPATETPVQEHSHVEETSTWTCSMHPQIRQEEFGLCPICEMDLIPVEANTSNDPLVLEMTEEAIKLSNIQTTIIGSGTAPENKLMFSGKIQMDERLSANQVAQIPGRIEQLFITFTGEKVEKGQKLASIYSPDLVAAQQELLEALKFKNINPDLINAARKKLEYWKIPAKQISEIENTGTVQETFLLFADVSGIVTQRRISVGDHVRQGQVLYDMVNLNRLWVIFDAYEDDLAKVKLGDKIEFSTPAVAGKNFSTRINFIDPVINPETRVASLRGEISNRAGLLKPEMFVRGNLESRTAPSQQLSVPKSAVLWTGLRSVVYVKLPDMTIPSFQYREIELGDRIGDNYLVTSGLEAGEEVVTYGNFTIDAAAQLNNQQSMMNKVVNLDESEAVDFPNYADETSDVFKTRLSELADAYIILKDAFVETNAEIAAQSADMFLKQLGSIKVDENEIGNLIFWQEQQSNLQIHAKEISTSEDVEQQRKQFGFLSDLMIRTIQSFGLVGEALYIQHCPMAFDNEGADWLSTEEAIRNPYFGDKMMKCGTVVGEIRL